MNSPILFYRQPTLVCAALLCALTLCPATDLRAQGKIAVKAKPDSLRTLEAFLQAKTVDELLKHVADREAVEPEIRAYYKERARKPVAAQGVKLANAGLIPGTKMEAHLYAVTVPRRQIMVSVEQTKAGFKVDWPTFTQFHEATLEKFIRKPGSPGGRFFVQLRRSHYFGSGIPDLDNLHPFRVQSPIPPFPESIVFLKKNNPTAEAIVEQYGWDKTYRPLVELKWVEPDNDASEPWIEVVGVVRKSWRR